ncbi:hypothetical protein PCK2_000854 [Pneumocystis canis]|nr:hypothetical protein PCK2_000854 [Pneumocystis canis]
MITLYLKKINDRFFAQDQIMMNPLIQSLDIEDILEKFQKCLQELSCYFEKNQFLCREIGLDGLNELDKLEESVLENQSQLQTLNTHLIPFFEQLDPISGEFKSSYECIDELEIRLETSGTVEKKMEKTLRTVRNTLEEEEKSIQTGAPRILQQCNITVLHCSDK